MPNMHWFCVCVRCESDTTNQMWKKKSIVSFLLWYGNVLKFSPLFAFSIFQPSGQCMKTSLCFSSRSYFHLGSLSPYSSFFCPLLYAFKNFTSPTSITAAAAAKAVFTTFLNDTLIVLLFHCFRSLV